MEQIKKWIESIGVSPEEWADIQTDYKDDPNGLRDYVLYLRAAFDDRHEYLD